MSEEYALRIKVDGRDYFTIQFPDGTTERATFLFGARHCRLEEVEVWRDGELFDTAEIHTIGTHGSYEGFEGLTKVFKALDDSRYHEMLKPKYFQPGDEIRIKEIRGKLTPLQYWREMTLDRAVPA